MTGPDVERERRQYQLMRDRVAAPRTGTMSVKTAVDDLGALLNETAWTGEAWKDAFIEHWSTLEIAYAVAADRRQPVPTATNDPSPPRWTPWRCSSTGPAMICPHEPGSEPRGCRP